MYWINGEGGVTGSEGLKDSQAYTHEFGCAILKLFQHHVANYTPRPESEPLTDDELLGILGASCDDRWDDASIGTALMMLMQIAEHRCRL